MCNPLHRQALALLLASLVASTPAFAQRRGSGNVRGQARSSVNGNRNVNRNQNINRNTNVNRNTNINVHRDVDVNVNHYYGGGYGYGCCYHPVATAVAVTATAMVTAAVIGSVVNTLPPSCTAVFINGITYQQCGGSWYQPQFAGPSVTYVVINPPR
jgi:hypothetical protein